MIGMCVEDRRKKSTNLKQKQQVVVLPQGPSSVASGCLVVHWRSVTFRCRAYVCVDLP